MKLVYDTITLEGIDKTGKNLICDYISALDRKYILANRGLASYQAYNIIYGRPITEYNVSAHKHSVIVYLTVDKEDWKIRCGVTKEPAIDFEYHSKIFLKTIDNLWKAGFHVIKINTSEDTPYEAAKKILKEVDALNEINPD